ncbi:MAG: alanyl-tRNA editing protein [Alphaproteobacteria bacterium]|jgi:misacylated tRNA(Ala) deacylase
MTVEKIFEQDAYAKLCDATVVSAGPEGIRLDATVFYAMGGGQLGDTGILRLEDGTEIEIIDTRKGNGLDDILHIAAEGAALPEAGAKLVAEIDWERRHRLMRMHTCLHLLCSLVDWPVTGGQINDGRGRLDFDVAEVNFDKPTLTEGLNRLISENHPVASRWISEQEFNDQPDLVRTMSVRPPSGHGQVRLLNIEGVDLQACGGTHVATTGEIGPVEVTKIENKGRQNRRVVVAFVQP